jgi:hypothetical protein
MTPFLGYVSIDYGGFGGEGLLLSFKLWTLHKFLKLINHD